MARSRILVIDDEESPRESLRYILKDRYEVVTKADGPSGLEALRGQGPFHLVLLDMKMPEMDGLDVLGQIVQMDPRLPVVIATAITDAKPAVQAMKLGAADYLNKPFDVEEIRLVVDRCLREADLRRDPVALGRERPTPSPSSEIIGSGPAMQQVFSLLQRLADAETTVLVLGETGTGKELVARALHYQSVRCEKPFVPVHCAAIPSELIESELFGHEKGAFTGALQRRVGMFEAANGGTLFLDEIGEMPLATQSKLLRAIQEREIRRVGSQETIGVNVRLVCATNRDLEQEVKKGTFREDLFYRINVVPIVVPPLRERREDIPVLVRCFAERLALRAKRAAPRFSESALAMLTRYPWPGNVRELEHTIERLVVTCDAPQIDPVHLPVVIAGATAEIGGEATPLRPAASRPSLGEVLTADSPPLANAAGDMDLGKMTEDLERRAIEEALRRANGVISEAARALNITRRILRYKMDKLGIQSADPGAKVEDDLADKSVPG